MLKMIIKFDTERLLTDNLYTEEMLYRNIEKNIEEVGLTKVSKGVYTDSGNEGALTYFLALMGWLRRAEWFRKYVVQWDWYNDYLGTEKDVEPENLLEDL